MHQDGHPAPLAAQIAAVEGEVGLDLAALARVLGVSAPMLRSVRDGERSRLGNPVALTRLQLLADLAGRLAAGAADPADTALSIAQIAAASGEGPGPSGPRPQSPLTRAGLAAARDRVAPWVRPSPALRWPLLDRATGAQVWVKHENHNPTGAFEVRGGLNLVARLLEGGPVAGLISAGHGNHAQSLAFAGATHGVPVTVVVAEGGSPDRNRATAALGAEVVVHGRDFQEAVEHAAELGQQRGLVVVPAFHPRLVEGIATAAAELHDAVSGLEVVYVPIGMGSNICAQIWVRDLLGAQTEIVGVVADRAPAYALSFEARSPVSTPDADTFVDGVACRTPDPDAVATIVGGAARVLRVSEEQAAEAMRVMYAATHNLAEPAGSLALAGLLAERDRVAGRRVAVLHTGSNCDFDVLARVMGAAGSAGR